jgi:hypothetical protein
VKTWGEHTGADFGGSLVGDLVFVTGAYSVVESLIWQSVLADACDAAAAEGDVVAPLVIDGGANIGKSILNFRPPQIPFYFHR